MARRGFFDSTTASADPVTGLPVGDNAEGSDFLADTLHTVLGNGVSMEPTSNLLVQTKTGLIVTLKAGKLWKNGYKLWETADRDITFTSSASEQTFYISGRLDVANNEFTHDEVYPYATFVAETDVCVAKIVIPANELTITDAMITDYRYNTTYCGVVDAYRLSLAALVVEYTAAIAALAAGGATGIEAVSYGAAQTLTAGEKTQALSNIGAASLDASSKVTATEASSSISVYADSGTLALADAGKLVKVTKETAATITIPLYAAVSFPIGTEMEIVQYGAGQVTVAITAGGALYSAGSAKKTAARYASVSIKCIAQDEWLLTGYLVS